MNTRVLVAAAVVGLGVVGALWWTRAAAGPALPDEVQATVEQRRAFVERYAQVDGLFDAMDRGPVALRLHNPGTGSLRLARASIFLDSSALAERLAGTGPSEAGALKVFALVRDHHRHRRPLFSDAWVHHPVRYLSMFGAGFCDDAANVTARLGRLFGMDSRVWALGGHIVAELYYDDAWHMFDPDGLGFRRDHRGAVAGMPFYVDAAKRGELGAVYNDIFKTEEDNLTRTSFGPAMNKAIDPPLEFFAGETKLLLPRPSMLVTDGAFLDRTPDAASFLGFYDPVGNLVRSIPVASLAPDDPLTEIADFFPIAGVFVQTTARRIRARVRVATPWAGDFWLEPATARPHAGGWIHDFSAGLAHLEKRPSFAVRLRDLRDVLRDDPDARLVLVLLYAAKNIDLAAPALDALRAGGVTVTRPATPTAP